MQSSCVSSCPTPSSLTYQRLDDICLRTVSSHLHLEMSFITCHCEYYHKPDEGVCIPAPYLLACACLYVLYAKCSTLHTALLLLFSTCVAMLHESKVCSKHDNPRWVQAICLINTTINTRSRSVLDCLTDLMFVQSAVLYGSLAFSGSVQPYQDCHLHNYREP